MAAGMSSGHNLPQPLVTGTSNLQPMKKLSSKGKRYPVTGIVLYFNTKVQLLLHVFWFCSVNKLQKSSLPSQKCNSFNKCTYYYIYIQVYKFDNAILDIITCNSPMINLRGKRSTFPFLSGHLIHLSLNLIHALRLQQRVALCILHIRSSFGGDSNLW